MGYSVEKGLTSRTADSYTVKQLDEQLDEKIADAEVEAEVTVRLHRKYIASSVPGSDTAQVEFWHENEPVGQTPEINKQLALIVGTAALQLGALIQQSPTQDE
jgi:hypothetical protein